MAEENGGLVATPIIIKEQGGTVYAVYGYFSPDAKETAVEKIRRLLSKESEKKSQKGAKKEHFHGQKGRLMV